MGFYVSGHPLDAYADVIAARNFQSIASLKELSDGSQFRAAGAIVQIDKKFTRREGKPFAVLWLEDLTAKLEVVVWNDVYVKVSESLATGRVVEIHGTLDTWGDGIRAVAQRVKILSAEKPRNGEAASASVAAPDSAVLLQFSAATTSDELREVREILASSPGQQRVQLLFDRGAGNPLRVEAGQDLCVALTRDLEDKLARWLVITKSERRNVNAL